MKRTTKHTESELEAYIEMARSVVNAPSHEAQWPAIAGFLTDTLSADLVGFFEKDPEGKIAPVFWHAPGDFHGDPPGEAATAAAAETISTASPVSRLLRVPTPVRAVCLPIVCCGQVTSTMFIGHKGQGEIPEHLLRIYTNIAYFTGHSLEQVIARRETTLRRQELEMQVSERTAELSAALEKLKHETHEREETEKTLAENYEQYRATFDAANDGIVIHDAETGAIVDVNRKFCEMTGFSRDEMHDIDMADISLGEGPFTGDRAVELLREAAEHGPVLIEWHARKKDGATFWVELNLRAMMIGDKNHLITIGRDITKRKKSEKRLLESRRALETLISNLPGMAYRCRNDRDWTMEFISDGCIPLTGYRPEDLVGNKTIAYGDIIHADDREYVWNAVQQGLEARQPFQISYRIRTADGGEKWLWEKGRGIYSESGELEALEGFMTDITDRVHTEEELRRNEERLALALEATRDGLWDWNIRTGEVYFSPRYYTMLGYEPFEFAPTYEAWVEHLHPDDRERTVKHVEEVIEQKKENFSIEFRLARKSGDFMWILSRGKVVNVDDEGKTVRMTGTHQDIDARKRAEKALHLEEEKFRTVVEQSPLGISLQDRDGCNFYLNPTFTKILGYTLDDIPDRNSWFEKAFPDETIRNDALELQSKDYELGDQGRIPVRTLPVACKDGSQKTIQFRAAKLESGNFLVIFEDITLRKRLEEQLRQAQKMEAVGTLAGGIAHDFNNLLMGIQGHVSMILADTDPESAAYQDLNGVQDIVKSAVSLTRQLLGFARGGKYDPKPFDPNDLLKKSSDLFGRTRREIDIQQKLQPGIWTIEADEMQIEQVLLNLYVNAWQAMPEGGTIYIQTENVTLDETFIAPQKMEPGDYVKISVGDTGIGMDEAVKTRIFEPFFTTKETGRGAGLGLAAAYGIIKNHGGIIDVYSEPEKGSTFNIYLPASNKYVAPERKVPVEIHRGSGTVLLVDDEEMIVSVGARMLEQLGYNVLPARSGAEAVEIFQENRDSIDLVLLDMIMPELSGRVTFERLREIAPGVKILLSSGYSAEGEAAEILERGCNGFIQKPFNLMQLSNKLRGILEG